MHDPLGLIAGLLFVSFFAYGRFNSPPTNRSSTTAMRYHCAAALYVLASLVLFVFFAHLLARSPGVLDNFLPEAVQKVIQSVASRSQTTSLSFYLLSALCLTVLLPKTPVLAQIDDSIRRTFQNFAAIPFEVRRLSGALRNAEFELPTEHQDAIAEQFQLFGLSDDALSLDAPKTLAHDWAKLLSLKRSLEELESSPRYMSFFYEFRETHEDLCEEFELLRPRAVSCLRLCGPLTTIALDAQVRAALSEYEASVRAATGRVLKQVYNLIARAVLCCELTASARRNRLEQIGFRGADTAANAVTLDHLSLLFICTFAIMMAAAVAGTHFDAARLGIGKSIQIALIYSAAVFWAVWLKRRQRPSAAPGFRPVLRYLCSAAFAVATHVLLSFAFRLVLMEQPADAYASLPRSFVWIPITLITALVTAWQCDNQPRFRLRWFEGGVQAGATAMAGLLAHWLIKRSPGLYPTDEEPALWLILATTSVVGFMIGSLVPHWYRAGVGVVESTLGRSDEDLSEGPRTPGQAAPTHSPQAAAAPRIDADVVCSACRSTAEPA